MSRIQHQLMTVVSCGDDGRSPRPFQDAHQRVGSDQRQLASHCFGRDRVIVEIEADIDGLRRAHGQNEIGREG